MKPNFDRLLYGTAITTSISTAVLYIKLC